jgi:hypothetical protein
MKASQAGASALLGFLQSLQQGQEQRNQQREQFLQQKQQQFDADRAFGLQKQQVGFAADEAAAAAERRKREDAEFARLAPVRELEATTALGKPDIDADAVTASLEDERAKLLSQQTTLQAQILSQRGPGRALLLGQLDQVNGSLEQLPARLQGRLQSIPGLKDPTKYITRFSQFGKPTQVTGAGAGVTGTGAGVTGTGTSGNVVTDTTQLPKQTTTVKRDDKYPLPPPTSEDIEAITGAINKYGLGNLGVSMYDMPTLTEGTRQYVDINGKVRTLKYASVKDPENIGLNAQKFLEVNMPQVQEALRGGLLVGQGRYIDPEETLKSVIGPDKALWPVAIDEAGNITNKTDFWKNLDPQQRLRLTSALQPFLKPDESTLAQITEGRRQRRSSLETQIADLKELRDQLFKDLTTKYEEKAAGERAKLTATNKVTPAGLTPKDLLEEERYTRDQVFEGIANDKSIVTKLDTGEVKLDQILTAIPNVNLSGISTQAARAFYQKRAVLAEAKFNTVRSGPVTSLEGLQARNNKLFGIHANATAQARDFVKTNYLHQPRGRVPLTPKQVEENLNLTRWLDAME